MGLSGFKRNGLTPIWSLSPAFSSVPRKLGGSPTRLAHETLPKYADSVEGILGFFPIRFASPRIPSMLLSDYKGHGERAAWESGIPDRRLYDLPSFIS
jgi:hypothetical protein